jgi:hypothetical protein
MKTKTLEYWKANAEEDYIKTPMSVLKYIAELEEQRTNTLNLLELIQAEVKGLKLDLEEWGWIWKKGIRHDL